MDDRTESDFNSLHPEVSRTAMIHVIATIELHEGQRDAFLTEFRRIVPDVLAEDGCLEYGPAVDIATDIRAQHPERPDAVTIIEKWESVEHLKQHLVAPHMGEYRGRVKGLIARTTLYVLSPA
jgi:quinol monooxygenase YgiN